MAVRRRTTSDPPRSPGPDPPPGLGTVGVRRWPVGGPPSAPTTSLGHQTGPGFDPGDRCGHGPGRPRTEPRPESSTRRSARRLEVPDARGWTRTDLIRPATRTRSRHSTSPIGRVSADRWMPGPDPRRRPLEHEQQLPRSRSGSTHSWCAVPEARTCSRAAARVDPPGHLGRAGSTTRPGRSGRRPPTARLAELIEGHATAGRGRPLASRPPWPAAGAKVETGCTPRPPCGSAGPARPRSASPRSAGRGRWWPPHGAPGPRRRQCLSAVRSWRNRCQPAAKVRRGRSTVQLGVPVGDRRRQPARWLARARRRSGTLDDVERQARQAPDGATPSCSRPAASRLSMSKWTARMLVGSAASGRTGWPERWPCPTGRPGHHDHVLDEGSVPPRLRLDADSSRSLGSSETYSRFKRMSPQYMRGPMHHDDPGALGELGHHGEDEDDARREEGREAVDGDARVRQ